MEDTTGQKFNFVNMVQDSIEVNASTDNYEYTLRTIPTTAVAENPQHNKDIENSKEKNISYLHIEEDV